MYVEVGWWVTQAGIEAHMRLLSVPDPYGRHSDSLVLGSRLDICLHILIHSQCTELKTATCVHHGPNACNVHLFILLSHDKAKRRNRTPMWELGHLDACGACSFASSADSY